jgi:hypothetical protein
MLAESDVGHDTGSHDPSWPEEGSDPDAPARKGVTDVSCAGNPSASLRTPSLDGYQYSRFCDRYRQYVKTLDVVLRKTYRPGESAFVDYAGATVPIVRPKTGGSRLPKILLPYWGPVTTPLSNSIRSRRRRGGFGAMSMRWNTSEGSPKSSCPIIRNRSFARSNALTSS